MRILIAGDWHSEIHEEAVFIAFEKLGHKVLKFPWCQYFISKKGSNSLSVIYLKVQAKYMFGLPVRRLNYDLIHKVAEEKPDILFVYRGSHIYSKTLRKVRQISPNTRLLGYNNDDPFSPQYPKWKWRHFLDGVPYYDVVFAYRVHNLNELKSIGAKQVKLLRSWFIKEKNFSIHSTSVAPKYNSDIIFIGHYENDSRLECLEEIMKRGWKLKIYGHDYGWGPVLQKSNLLSKFLPIKNLWGDDYNKALSASKISLCFLSKLNRDTYTRRCFEIPASGSMLLAEYTDDLASMFKPDQEAVFFSSPEELTEKLEFYLNNEELRFKVAQAGLKRVHDDGHDVVSRMEYVIKVASKF